MSLPPTLKALLSTRRPNAIPSPPLSKLLPVLKTTFEEAQARQAGHGWMAVAMATFLTANSPASITHVYRFISRRNYDAPESGSLLPLQERLSKAAIMREVGLKCAVFVGVPRTINSLAALTQSLEEDVIHSLRKTPIRTDTNLADISDAAGRGRRLFDSVYHPHTEKLLAKLGSYHPDFPGFILHQEYGALLADPVSLPAEGRVGRTLTSVAGVACLRAEGGVGPQLTSHVYGLLKARQYEGDKGVAAGRDGIEDNGQGDRWLSSVEGAIWVIETTDRLRDTLAQLEADPVSKL